MNQNRYGFHRSRFCRAVSMVSVLTGFAVRDGVVSHTLPKRVPNGPRDVGPAAQNQQLGIC